MANSWDDAGVRLKEDAALRAWDASAAEDPGTTALDLAHAVLFGKAQAALEAVAAGGAGLTTDHARALHFANEMAQLRHYGPLTAVDDGLPVLAPGVRAIIATFDAHGVWDGRPAWNL